MSSTITSTTTRQPVLPVATEKVSGTNLLAAAYGGKVTFAKVRGTGTLRHWPVLAKGTPARKTADDIMARRAKGETVEAIAKGLHKSVPTVRRTITALAFTLELEGLSAKDRAAIAKAAVANMEEAAKKVAAKPTAPKEPAKAEAKPATKGTKSPAKPASKGSAKPASKGKRETSAQRIKRMQAEGTAKVPSPVES